MDDLKSRPALALLLALVACSGEPEPATPDNPSAEAPTPSTTASTLPELTPGTKQLKSPHILPAGPDVEKTLEVLSAVVSAHGLDPENPWAVAHAMLALGPDVTLPDGAPALDTLYGRYAKAGVVSGRELPSFPANVGEIKVEPHTDLLLKVFTETGISPERVVKVGEQEFEVGDHYHHSMLTTFLKKTDGSSSYASPNDMPWGVQALSQWAAPGMAWTAFEGTEMTLDDLAKLMVHVLTSESAFMIRAMLANEDFEKKGQGIFGYTCGGAHLLQGSIIAVARGFGGDAEREKMHAQGQLLFYRLPRELGLYAEAAKQHPDKKLVLLAQQLKFVGHWLESAHKIAASGLYAPTAAEQARMAEAVDILVVTVKQLKAMGAFDNLTEIRKQNEQLYLDLVGDSAHAIRGLELALGRQVVRL